MAIALDYPLGWPLVPSAPIRRSRMLPPGAAPFVAVGASVRADQPIAEQPLNGGVVAPLLAGLAGTVIEAVAGQWVTIEGTATVLQGVLGVGGQAAGPLQTLPRGESLAVVPIPPGAVILYPQPAPLMLLQRAAASGAAGVIAPSVSVRELEAFARVDLTLLLDGLAFGFPQPPLSVLLTEGLGALPMAPATFQVLSQHAQRTVLLAGRTVPSRNARPEVLLSLPPGTPAAKVPLDSRITEGAFVVVSGGPGRGARGEVVHVFARQQLTGPGILTRAATVRLEDGNVVVLPLHTLDRIG